ncbi:redoxin family protein [Alteromonas ponticola]|uniref:Redoxin family protein n=1 Tax=Alteromonas ponticola TaxID=2720613 RepID=A0ABX1QYJ8_9ALTE|nr:redoxin family protein [Alteromonas ponticola]NMH59310.1 redoxin family protein [Alteromonas ponticola]
MRKITLLSLPLIGFCLLIVFLYKGLFSDPRALDSQISNQPVPQFTLPDLLDSNITYTPDVFKNKVTILNVWGVWCITCAIELPYLTQLKETQNVRFVGLYFDQDLDPDFGEKSLPQIQQEVKTMLSKYGNPYEFNIFDIARETALDLGVTGAPEHFLIDKSGVVRMHHVGDINERVWQNKLKPVYQTLLQEPDRRFSGEN